MKTEQRKYARIMRIEEGLGIGIIAKKLGVSKSTVSYWVRDIELNDTQKDELTRRSGQCGNLASTKKWTELRERNRETGRAKAKNREWLYVLGCSLYWAEGSKKRNGITLTNTDSSLIKLFLEFLRKYFRLDNSEITFALQLYGDSDIVAAKKFWQQTLDLEEGASRSIYIKSQTSGRMNKYPNGICSVSVNRTDIVQEIYGAIEEISGSNNHRFP